MPSFIYAFPEVVLGFITNNNKMYIPPSQQNRKMIPFVHLYLSSAIRTNDGRARREVEYPKTTGIYGKLNKKHLLFNSLSVCLCNKLLIFQLQKLHESLS